MHILLVNPEFPPSFWSFHHALKIAGKKALLPPLGLLTVAALLPAAWEKRLVDVALRPLTDADLAWADYVFVGGMGVQWRGAAEVIRRAKAAGKKVVAGGPLFTVGYALFQEVDHFVLNEGELMIPQLVADIQRGTPKRLYRTREFADMATSPVPLWKLADLKQYAYIGVQYSRGCPFDCDFCNVTAMLGRNPRIKAAPQVIAELDALRAAGNNARVFFVDDNLIGNKRALRDELLPALSAWQKRRGPMLFNSQVSINLADDAPLTAAMVEAGFDVVFVGIETSDPEALKECKKGQNRNRNLLADVHKLQRAGLEVQAGFIVGFDQDTPETFQQQIAFVQASGIPTAMVGQLQAPPGTQLHRRLAAEGRLLGVSFGDNTDGMTNVVPKMGLQALREGHAQILSAIYAPRAYYQRVRSFLRRLPPPRVRLGLGLEEIGAFLRACWYLGVLGRERFYYWGLLAWTLFTRPALLPMATRLAAYGLHTQKMSAQVARAVKQPLPELKSVLDQVGLAGGEPLAPSALRG